MKRLFDVVLDLGKERVQIGTKAGDRYDDGYSDAGGNQSIFNGGRTLVTADKPGDCVHARSLLAR